MSHSSCRNGGYGLFDSDKEESLTSLRRSAGAVKQHWSDLCCWTSAWLISSMIPMARWLMDDWAVYSSKKRGR